MIRLDAGGPRPGHGESDVPPETAAEEEATQAYDEIRGTPGQEAQERLAVHLPVGGEGHAGQAEDLARNPARGWSCGNVGTRARGTKHKSD